MNKKYINKMLKENPDVASQWHKMPDWVKEWTVMMIRDNERRDEKAMRFIKEKSNRLES